MLRALPSISPGFVLGLSIFAAPLHAFGDTVLEEIVVKADLRESPLTEMPVSVAILDEGLIDDAAVQHFEELTRLVPNLNWAGGSSRPRYFQIRGIGERSQYEGAPNPSVGFIVDDIDFSSMGGIATLFDTERVEVLRGPQGTRYGANALAGLVYVRSRMPTEEFEASAEVTAADDSTVGAGIAFGGPVDGAGFSYRVAAHSYETDGFRRNAYFGGRSTSGRDESMLRAKLAWQGGGSWRVDATGFYADLDNRYDHWAVDNGRTTYSDNPGKDSQRSLAGAVRVSGQPTGAIEFTSITSVVRSDVRFSFDADWGNTDFWAPYTYDFFSETVRDRETISQEFRIHSMPGTGLVGGRVDWIAGVYGLRLRESNLRRDTGVYNDFFFPPFVLDDRVDSEYEATTTAAFGELDIPLADRLSIRAGLRLERRDADYLDTSGSIFSPSDDMVGGQIALTWRPTDNLSAYTSIARGYKAGGFNLGFAGRDDVGTGELLFDPEYLWNAEAGVRVVWPDSRLRGSMTVFYSKRRDVQIETSAQLNPNDPTTFIFFTDNAGSGTNAGVEATLEWMPRDDLSIDATLGLLDTEIERFGTNTALEGRDQAHAPAYSFAVAATWRHAGGWMTRLDVTGRDGFFYSNSHDQKSESAVLVGARIGYEAERWSAYLWASNLLDEDYTQRGFFFGNEPPDFPPVNYRRLGDPRHVGVTLAVDF